MNAEQQIAEKLNGWFFRVDLETGKVSARQVPRDYIPTHRPRWLPAAEHIKHNNTNGMGFEWTEEQDREILAMREEGLPWKVIGYDMGCSAKTVRYRHAKLTNTVVG